MELFQFLTECYFVYFIFTCRPWLLSISLVCVWLSMWLTLIFRSPCPWKLKLKYRRTCNVQTKASAWFLYESYWAFFMSIISFVELVAKLLLIRKILNHKNCVFLLIACIPQLISAESKIVQSGCRKYPQGCRKFSKIGGKEITNLQGSSGKKWGIGTGF